MSATDLPMRIGVGKFMDPSTEKLQYAKQPGVNDVLVNMYRLAPEYPHAGRRAQPA